MHGARGLASLLIGLAAVWVLFTAAIDPAELILGIAVVVLVALFVRSEAGLFGGVKLGIRALVLVPVYLGLFVWKLVLANLDMARRVLSPRIPLNPGIVAVPTDLQSRIGILILANSITLTPGTLTLDVEKETLYVHWIDVHGEGAEEARAEIAAPFERALKGVVE